MPPPKRFWREMSTQVFADHDTSDWIAVLPTAAIEQHGPHLPVGVDALIAEAMVNRAAVALPEHSPAVFLPVQEICKSDEHIAFPGTLTLDWEAAIKSWLQIGASVARAGVRKLLIITSHGGNVPPMDIVARELRRTAHMAVITTAWTRLRAGPVYEYGDAPVIDIHGGLSETSMMLALWPELVDKAQAGNFTSAQTMLRQGSAKLGYHMAEANMAWLSQDLNPKGAVGNASAATAELGVRDVTGQIEGFCALIEDIARVAPPDQGSPDKDPSGPGGSKAAAGCHVNRTDGATGLN
ncbi:MAG: creatininase family protein [Rhodobacteraceae bacterium]|nr:creatininase family protein [Paracoccaceae bacterium]